MGLYRWAGSKDRILQDLFSIMNCEDQFNNWIVPFFGGGSDSISALISGFAGQYHINDKLLDIICTILAIRDHWLELSFYLKLFDEQPLDYQINRFEELRNSPNADLKLANWGIDRIRNSPQILVDCAFRFLVLQACGYRGLWRVNKKGKYNVPFNRKAVFDFNDLQQGNRIFNKRALVITYGDFESVIAIAGKGDLVYADPPYIGTHSSYSSIGFTLNDHHRLYQALRQAVIRGAICWLSGSDHSDTKSIYYGTIHNIDVRRSMSRKAQALNESKHTNELLIRIAA